MKKIEYAELHRMGASAKALKFYSGTDFIQAIYQDGDQYIITGIDGNTTFSSSDELIQELEAMAETEEE